MWYWSNLFGKDCVVVLVTKNVVSQCNSSIFFLRELLIRLWDSQMTCTLESREVYFFDFFLRFSFFKSFVLSHGDSFDNLSHSLCTWALPSVISFIMEIQISVLTTLTWLRDTEICLYNVIMVVSVFVFLIENSSNVLSCCSVISCCTWITQLFSFYLSMYSLHLPHFHFLIFSYPEKFFTVMTLQDITDSCLW